ncbi:hypothetical protein [Methylobacterium sp. WSM2598]|uniref:hypothetical protein n=1 Tax=Methylobacterium sp. WSM2598 TaxID=398261 RepID=UPI00038053C9|nr:hypothetical protein [Methylobacterium sp. WSM2598]
MSTTPLQAALGGPALRPLAEEAGSVTVAQPAAAILVVWGTLALLALADPRPIADWLDEMEPNPVVRAAQGGAARLVAASEALGLAQLSGRVREASRTLTRRP